MPRAMQLTDRIHRLRIDFRVAENIERFVYLYLVIGRHIHVIDTGVAGAAGMAERYLETLGRSMDEVRNVLLTHSHPDHIGDAAEIRERTGAVIHAPEAERGWIEDIDRQCRERPVPNFHALVRQPVAVDRCLSGGDTVVLEEGMTVHVVATPGHSHGSLSFHLAEDDAVFTGDAIPVPGDISIYVSVSDSLDSLERLRGLEAGLYLPAWDDVYTRGTVGDAIDRSAAGLGTLHAAVVEAAGREPAPDVDTLCRDACRAIGRPGLADIPLFRRSVLASLAEWSRNSGKRRPLPDLSTEWPGGNRMQD